MIAGIIYQFNSSQVQDIRSKAEDDNAKFCQDHCKPEGKSCDLTSPSTEECCEEIRKTGDPLACPWPERGYCSIDQCAAIPEGVNRQRCAGPRHSWCGECQTHNCPGYGINPTQPPVPPTAVIEVPTKSPPPTLPIPTVIPNPANPIIPTQSTQPTNPRPQITYAPIVYPTHPPPALPTIVPTTKPFAISLPNFSPVREKVDVFMQKTKFSIFDFLSKILP